MLHIHRFVIEVHGRLAYDDYIRYSCVKATERDLLIKLKSNPVSKVFKSLTAPVRLELLGAFARFLNFGR
jgi:hypothetical protein